jgi:hypothetical protein
MPDPITRDTLLRIALAVGPIDPANFPTRDDLEQLGAIAELLAVTVNDRRYIHCRYLDNRGRKVGRYTLSFAAAAVLARVEWMAEVLGVEANREKTNG